MRDILLKIGHYFVGGAFGKPYEYIDSKRVYCDISTWSNSRLINWINCHLSLLKQGHINKDVMELFKRLPEIRKLD